MPSKISPPIIKSLIRRCQETVLKYKWNKSPQRYKAFQRKLSSLLRLSNLKVETKTHW